MKRQSLLLTAGLIVLTAAATTVTAQAVPAQHKARHMKLYNSVPTPNAPGPGTDYDSPAWPEGRPDYHGSNGG